MKIRMLRALGGNSRAEVAEINALGKMLESAAANANYLESNPGALKRYASSIRTRGPRALVRSEKRAASKYFNRIQKLRERAIDPRTGRDRGAGQISISEASKWGY